MGRASGSHPPPFTHMFINQPPLTIPIHKFVVQITPTLQEQDRNKYCKADLYNQKRCTSMKELYLAIKKMINGEKSNKKYKLRTSPADAIFFLTQEHGHKCGFLATLFFRSFANIKKTNTTIDKETHLEIS